MRGVTGVTILYYIYISISYLFVFCVRRCSQGSFQCGVRSPPILCHVNSRNESEKDQISDSNVLLVLRSHTVAKNIQEQVNTKLTWKPTKGQKTLLSFSEETYWASLLLWERDGEGM